MKYKKYWTLKKWLAFIKIKIALREQKEHSKKEHREQTQTN